MAMFMEVLAFILMAVCAGFVIIPLIVYFVRRSKGDGS